MVFLGYRYLDRKIPDEIHIDRNSGLDFSSLSGIPFVSFGDTITVSGEGSYQLPCTLLGKIHFKDIKVTPTEADSILVSGSSMGIYMETSGVLVIDEMHKPINTWTCAYFLLFLLFQFIFEAFFIE